MAGWASSPPARLSATTTTRSTTTALPAAHIIAFTLHPPMHIGWEEGGIERSPPPRHCRRWTRYIGRKLQVRVTIMTPNPNSLFYDTGNTNIPSTLTLYQPFPPYEPYQFPTPFINPNSMNPIHLIYSISYEREGHVSGDAKSLFQHYHGGQHRVSENCGGNAGFESVSRWWYQRAGADACEGREVTSDITICILLHDST